MYTMLIMMKKWPKNWSQLRLYTYYYDPMKDSRFTNDKETGSDRAQATI
jgi:hypothetical protein